MSGWKASEATTERFLVVRHANARTDQSPTFICALSISTNDVGGDVCEVRVTSRKQVRARFAEQILCALSDEEGHGEGESKASPPFLELA